jgi:DNA/RNA non-specific endonuclease
MQPIWLLRESGKVGDDGMIRTSSPPWNGIEQTGEFTVVVPTFNYSRIDVEADITKLSVLYTGAVTLAILSGGLGMIYHSDDTQDVFEGSLNILAHIPTLLNNVIPHPQISVLTIPTFGLPYMTTAGVEINPGQIPTAKVEILPHANSSDFQPAVTNVEVKPEKVNGSAVTVLTLSGQHFGDFAHLQVDLITPTGIKIALTVIPELSNNNGKLTVRPTDLIPLSAHSKIQITRTYQTAYQPTPTTFKSELVDLPNQALYRDLSLVPQTWNNKIAVFNTTDPHSIIDSSVLGSPDLLLAKIPVGRPGLTSDGPRYVAVTSDATVAYTPLESEGRVAVVDLISLQQVNTNQGNIDPTIALPTGAHPFSIVIDSLDKYAYVADRYPANGRGQIYVIDLDPHSAHYHKHIQTIQIGTNLTDIAQMALSGDGKYMFITAPKATDGKGHIIAVNIDLQAEHQVGSTWHQQVADLVTDLGVTGITTAPGDSSHPERFQMVITNRQNDPHGFGVITVVNDHFTDAQSHINYTPLLLGAFNDYFDVNEAVAVTITEDGKYAFVAGKNSRNLGQLIPSVDADNRAGSNVGIIVDPLTDHAKLVAATLPIPDGRVNGLALSGDGKVLTAAYQGINSGAIFAFDVQELIKTIEHPELFFIDNPLAENNLTPNDTPHQATLADFAYIPIDSINPKIDQIAADFYRREDASGNVEFVVPAGSKTPPVIVGGNTFSVTAASDWLKLNDVPTTGSTNDLTPAFSWQFDNNNYVDKVNLFVSTFDEGQGLLPWDETVNLSDPQLLPGSSQAEKLNLLSKQWQGYNDFNPGRILTATWENNQWKLSDGTTSAGDRNHFTLPDSHRLTAGQTYHWAVQGIMLDGKKDTEIGSFDTKIEIDTTSPFSTVNILTHGFSLEPSPTGVPDEFYQLGNSIIHQDKLHTGLMLGYDKKTGNWIPVDEHGVMITQLTGGLSTSNPNYATTLASNIKSLYLHSSLVLLPEWSTSGESTVPDAGFSEAAADSLFASIVKLDQSLGGSVGEHDASNNLTQLYDNQGDLIRNQGLLLNSDLHFIGFSRGTVVNSEIIQRLGTYFPHAGGVYRDANGKVIKGDLQMTTIDPHDFKQDNLNKGFLSIVNNNAKDYSNFYEPPVQVWNNVTFADNYYQTSGNTDGLGGLTSATPNGRELVGADVNKDLTGLTGFFQHDNGLGNTHSRVLTWYAGTLDLSLDRLDKGTPTAPIGYTAETQLIYDELGDPALVGMNVKASDLTNPWYQGNHSNEGIGEGWYYSYLGGGEDSRTHSAVARTSVFTDNSNLTQQKGDDAVPAVFNGTFDSALNKDSSNIGIPGWSFNNGQDLSGSQPIAGGFKLVNQKNIVNLKKLIQDNSVLADWAACQNIDNSKLNDYHALRLNMDTGNVAIHNKTYLSATAQTLSFDLFTPNLSGSTAGDTLKVYMSEDGLNFNEINSPNPTRYSSPPTVDYNLAQWGDLSHRPAVDLQLPDNSLVSGYDIQYQLNRPDYARRGFETFYLNIPDRFRGKTVYIKFELSSTHGQTIYLDNVGVANANTKLGLPRLNGQLAVNSEEFQTQFKNNYLIVKPQYTLSYNDATKIPNWVSFQLNCSWIEQEQTVNIDRKNAEPFSIDTDIPLTPVLNDYYKSSLIPSLQRGHLAGADERKRTQKDLSATFVTSNILPSFEPKPWQDFEIYLRSKVMYTTGGERKNR